MANGELSNVVSNPQDDPAFRNNVVKMTGYMKFIGIINIIFGSLYCLLIVGAIIGIPAIFVGLRMREAAENFDKYSLSGAFQDLSAAIEKQTRFFFIQFVLLIIGIILIFIYILVLIAILSGRS